MSTALARALTMIAVFFQSYFNWDPGSSDNSKVGRALVGPESVNGGAYHLAGLILARGGSKGIPRKNMVEVNGRPLVGRSLDAMIESGVFTTIWVSTDDPEIIRWVKSHYVNEGTSPATVAIHKRASYTATDSASSISAVLEFLSFHPEIDAVGLVQATSPFVQPEYLRQAAHKLLDKASLYESVFSVTRSHQLRWAVEEGDTSNKDVKVTKPLNFNPKNRPRRQEWPGEMVENGMFYFTVRHILVNYQTFQTDRSSSYVEIPKHLSLEIDSFQDLEIARCLAARIDGKNGSPRLSQQEQGHNHKTKATFYSRESTPGSRAQPNEL